MNIDRLADQILKEVGGKDNIKEMFHCVTRLRFYLKDRSVVNPDRLKALDGVLGVQFQTEQLQIIIGNEVGNVYNAIINKTGFIMDDATKEKKEKMRLGGIFEAISAIILPVIPAMAGTGILKGVSTIMTSYLGFDSASTLIQMITIASDAVFYFLPFFIAWSAAKRFKTDTAMALLCAGMLLYPTMTNGLAEGLEPMSLFGLPIPFVKYASSSIPIILTVFVLKYVYAGVNKIIPKMLQLVFTPLITVLIMCPIALGVTGPIANYISQGIASLVAFLFDFSPLVAGAVVGATRSLLVFTGMHLSLGAVCMQNLAVYGYDVILPVNTMGTMAIVGVCLGVWIKAKKPENKSVASSAFISSFLGITEPGIYGVLLKYKKALIADIIAGGVAGALVAVGGGHATAYVNSCILSLPVFVGDGFFFVCLGMAVATVLGCVLVLVMGIDEGGEPQTVPAGGPAMTQAPAQVPAGSTVTESIASPMQGTVVPLSQVSDPVFSSETLGKGIAIEPADGSVTAPFDGTISTGSGSHAVCLVSDSGIECLIHIGLDTVHLKGQHYDFKVREGMKVKKGDLLVQVDLDAVRAAGYKTVTPIIITNSGDFLDVFPVQESGPIARGDALLTLIKKG